MNGPFTTQITPEQGQKIRQYAQANGLDLSYPRYTHFNAKITGLSITYYQSGKLVIQGKNKDDFIRFFLEPEILCSLEYSNPITTVDLHPHIGVDEAGKGDLFGPLCVAAVQADTPGIERLVEMGIKDSKTLSDKLAHKQAKIIKQHFSYEILYLYPSKYNELYKKFGNLNTLLAWCHARVIQTVATQTNCPDVLIDQFAAPHLVANAVKRLNIPINLEQRHRGESDPVVAAASILARAAFLEGLQKLSTHYEIELPKGASQIVQRAGRSFLDRHGEAEFGQVAKLHFKTAVNLLKTVS